MYAYCRTKATALVLFAGMVIVTGEVICLKSSLHSLSPIPHRATNCTVTGFGCTGEMVTVKSAGIPGCWSPSTTAASPTEITGAEGENAYESEFDSSGENER